MPNATLTKFGIDDNLILSYHHWHLLLRFKQPTLGSLILICKGSYSAFSDLPKAASHEMHEIIPQIEIILKDEFAYSNINYLMLMMLDPEVHFHIIPRYEFEVQFEGAIYQDTNWPAPPNLAADIGISKEIKKNLLARLRSRFTEADAKHSTSNKKYGRLYTSGCFDIFHHGHLNIIQKSKALCDHLIIGVSTDELIIKEKGNAPIIPFDERVSMVESIDGVDEVIPQVDKNKQRIVDENGIDAISVGSDWKGRYPIVSCEMEYFDYTPSVSSTIIKQRLDLMNK
jgi:glycerol-3-phosphate cytidylyltransferase